MGSAVPKYRLIRSRHRTVSLQIAHDGTVVVRAPLTMPDRQIERFVAAHAEWIARARERARRNAALFSADPQQLAALRRAAQGYIPGRVEYYSRLMGLVPTAVRITAAKTRFGSCSGKNSLCFSLFLMRFPPEAIDAVVVHELAHIRHHNHGREFYALIERYMPDYRQRQLLLKNPAENY